MDRRRLLGAGVGLATVGFAGCLDREDEDETPDDEEETDGGELRVVVPERFVRQVEAPGRWLADQFEQEHDDELVWVSPEAGVDLYLERARRELPTDADLTMALSATDVARIVDADVGLLGPLGSRLRERAGRVRERFTLDHPRRQVVAYLGEYVCVLHGDDREPPATLAALADEAADDLVVQDPRRSPLGRAFLHWTVAEFGDDAFEFWERLADGGVTIDESWDVSYERYLDGERSLLIALASQRPLAELAELDVDRHQVAYPDDRGYAAPTFAGIFRDATRPELAAEFLETLLSAEGQAAVADRAGGVATLQGVSVASDDEVAGRSPEPPEVASLPFDTLIDGHEAWLERWAESVGVG